MKIENCSSGVRQPIKRELCEVESEKEACDVVSVTGKHGTRYSPPLVRASTKPRTTTLRLAAPYSSRQYLSVDTGHSRQGHRAQNTGTEHVTDVPRGKSTDKTYPKVTASKNTQRRHGNRSARTTSKGRQLSRCEQNLPPTGRSCKGTDTQSRCSVMSVCVHKGEIGSATHTGDSLYSQHTTHTGDSLYSHHTTHTGNSLYSHHTTHTADSLYTHYTTHTGDSLHSHHTTHTADSLYSHHTTHTGDSLYSHHTTHTVDSLYSHHTTHTGDSMYSHHIHTHRR